MALLLRLHIVHRLLPAASRHERFPLVCGARKFAKMGKRKQDSDSEPELDSEEADEEALKKPKKRAAPRKAKPKFSEPFVDEQGWHIEPPSIIWRDFGTEPGDKIAAFDLVRPWPTLHAALPAGHSYLCFVNPLLLVDMHESCMPQPTAVVDLHARWPSATCLSPFARRH